MTQAKMGRWVHGLLRDEFLRLSAVFVAMNAVGSLLTMAYRIMLGRLLTTEQYGEMDAMLQFGMLLSIPIGAVQLAIIHFVAKAVAGGHAEVAGGLLWRAFRRMGIYSVIVIVTVGVMAPWLRDFLHLNSVWPIHATLSGVIAIFLFTVASAGVQGAERFVAIGFVGIAGAVARIGISYLMIRPGFGATGALAGTAGSTLVMALLAVLCVWPMLKAGAHTRVDTSPVYRYLWPTLAAMGVGCLLGSVDMLIVKHYFDKEAAGLYARASAVARIGAMVNSALLTVLFPRVTSEATQGRSTRGLLLRSAGLGLAVSAGTAVVFTFWPSVPIRILHGDGYDGIAPWMIGLTWALIPGSILGFAVQYLMGRHDFRFLIPYAAAAVLYGIGLWLFHDTIPVLIGVIAVGGCLGLVACLCGTLRDEKGWSLEA
jgi:O-antigen/teichoic acid export membrane protein